MDMIIRQQTIIIQNGNISRQIMTPIPMFMAVKNIMGENP
jgi:hypothetical protein